MFRGITDLFAILGKLLPIEVLVPVLVVVAIAAVPVWWRSVKTRQIKGQLRRAARAHGEAERAAFIERAFDMAGSKPRLLVGLVEQAISNGQRPVWKRGLQALEDTGRAELDVAALRRRVLAPPKTVRDPLEAIVRIERLQQAGLHVAAREVIEEALALHPHDPELRSLADTLQTPPNDPPSPR